MSEFGFRCESGFNGLPGYEAPSPALSPDLAREASEAVVEALGFDFYAFLLYHSANQRLAKFLREHFVLLDRISGTRIAIFAAVPGAAREHHYSSALQARQANSSVALGLKTSRSASKKNLTADASFFVAAQLNIARASLPCMVVYRHQRNGVRGFAMLKLRDDWFPSLKGNPDELANTVGWLSKLFDSVDGAIGIGSRRDAIEQIQRNMSAAARKNNIYRPILDTLKGSIEPVVKLPFRLVDAIPRVLESAGSRLLTTKFEG